MIAELVIQKGVPTNKAKAEIEIQPAKVFNIV